MELMVCYLVELFSVDIDFNNYGLKDLKKLKILENIQSIRQTIQMLD